MQVFLSGPMGAGKSTVAAVLGRRLGLPVVDLDERIEAQAGASVAALFERLGERGFRGIERRAVATLGEAPCVVALGGGAVTDASTRHLLIDRGTLVTLRARPEELARRVEASSSKRPLLAGGEVVETIRAILEDRADAYAECHAVVDTDDRSPDEVAERIEAVIRDLPVVVPLGRRTYRVEIGAGVRSRLADRVAEAGSGTVVLVSDGGPERPWPGELEAALARTGRAPLAVKIPEGEVHKTIETVTQIWDAALEGGVDRGAVVVGVGGGVVGDLTAFAASTLLRGVALGQVPTTLLSMVDSSVGGKTGFNRPRGKNLVGTFYQPRFVLCDVETLATLPVAERTAGLAEVVKSAWLDGEASVAMLEADAVPLASGDPQALVRAIRMSVRLKARIVRDDERESGPRMLLNLGHTIGHGLEAAAGYEGLRHGEAVALGMIAALRLGRYLGKAPAESAERLERLMRALGLPVDLDARLDDRALGFVTSDKKMKGGRVQFVIPGVPGRTELVPLTPDEIRAAVRA